MSCASINRIEKEQQRFPHLHISPLVQTSGKRHQWILQVPGPANSLYEGLVYELEVEYDSGYPFTKPYTRFRTPMFHPNITPSGQMSNLLIEPWAPLYTIETLYTRAQHLLANPQSNYYYNMEAAHYMSTPEEFRKRIIALHNTYLEEYSQLPHLPRSVPAHTGTDTRPADSVHYATDD